MLIQFWPLLSGNLWRRPVRTGLTMAVVAVTFLLFGLLQSVRHAFVEGVQLAGQDRLLTVSRISVSEPVPLVLGNRLGATPGVELVTHVSYIAAYFRDPRERLFAQPVDPLTYLLVYPEFRVSAEALQAWQSDRTTVLIGTDLVTRYGWKVGDVVPVQSGVYRTGRGENTWPVRVVGVFEGPPGSDKNRNMLMHHSYVNDSRTSDRDTVGWFVVKTARGTDPEEIARLVDALSEGSSTPTRTVTEADMVLKLVNQFGNIGALLTAMAGIAFATMLIVLMASLAQAVRERGRETATFRAIGYPVGLLAGLVVVEAILITVIPAALGLALAWLAVGALAPKLSQLLPALKLEPLVVGSGLLIAVVIAMAAAALPVFETRRYRLSNLIR